MLQQAQNDFYASEEEAVMDYAAAVNAEIRDRRSRTWTARCSSSSMASR
jgi:methionine synthase II (cobalamin-independent)